MNHSSPPSHSVQPLASAQQAVEKSRLALQQDDRRSARRWAEQGARLDPQLEDPWLLLAALASPRASLAYLQKALEINPSSQRARKGMAWALDRLETERQKAQEKPPVSDSRQSDPITVQSTSRSIQPASLSVHSIGLSLPASRLIKLEDQAGRRDTIRKPQERTPIIFWYALGILFFALLFLTTSLAPFFPQLVTDVPQNMDFLVDEMVEISLLIPETIGGEIQRYGFALFTPTQPAYQPPQITESAASPTPYLPVSDTPTALPSPTPTTAPSATPIPTETPLPSPTPTVEPSPSPSAALSPPTAAPSPQPTKKPKKKTAAAAAPGLRPQNVSLNDRWLDVDLSAQQVFAMQGSQAVRSFVVSTGRWPTVTVTGTFKIYVKYRTANMTGDDYFLPNVPYVMYFFKGYGLHGTYWHNNFGTPMSHGCVNLRPDDAAWLFDFASVGTIVHIHP